MAQKVVLRCNSLVYNQISNQNLAISNIWPVNWHFMFKFCPKMTENPKKIAIFFRRKFELVFQFLSDSSKISYIVSLRVLKTSYRGFFLFFYFLSFYGASKVKNGHFGGFWGFFTRSSARKIWKNENFKNSRGGIFVNTLRMPQKNFQRKIVKTEEQVKKMPKSRLKNGVFFL